jgi:ribosomal protein S14
MRKSKKEFIYKNNINLYYLNENKLIFYKFLLFSNLSKNLKYHVRQYIYNLPVKKKALSCIFSGRRKSVNKKLLLSRIVLRDLIYNGNLLGYNKAS